MSVGPIPPRPTARYTRTKNLPVHTADKQSTTVGCSGRRRRQRWSGRGRPREEGMCVLSGRRTGSRVCTRVRECACALLPDTLTGSRARAPRRTCAQREGRPRAAAHLPRHGRRIARRGALKRRRCLLMRLFPRAAWLRTPTLGSNWHYSKSSDLVLRDVDFFECGEWRSATQDERTFTDALARTWLPSRVGCACVG